MKAKAYSLLLVAAMIILGGCATANGPSKQPAQADACGDPSMTPSEQNICHARYDTTVAEGTALGIGAGAGIGCGLGYLLAGKDGCVMGAVAGAGVGGYVGNQSGKDTAQKTAEANNQIRKLDQLTQDLKQKNADLQASLVAAKSMVTEGKQRLQLLAYEQKNKGIGLEQAKAEQDKIGRDRENLNLLIKNYEARRADFQTQATKVDRTGQDIQEYNRQLATLDQKIGELKKLRDDLSVAMT